MKEERRFHFHFPCIRMTENQPLSGKLYYKNKQYYLVMNRLFVGTGDYFATDKFYVLTLDEKIASLDKIEGENSKLSYIR